MKFQCDYTMELDPAILSATWKIDTKSLLGKWQEAYFVQASVIFLISGIQCNLASQTLDNLTQTFEISLDWCSMYVLFLYMHLLSVISYKTWNTDSMVIRLSKLNSMFNVTTHIVGFREIVILKNNHQFSILYFPFWFYFLQLSILKVAFNIKLTLTGLI